MGSKNRHAKELLPIILENRTADQWYIEPFVGGFNMIDKVTGNRIANDSHFYLIELFKAIQNGWVPPCSVSELQYNAVKNNKEYYHPALVGFIGFGCSYAGKWFSGYARSKTAKGKSRNYALESRKNILKQDIDGIVIFNKNYIDLEIPEKSIIYCDPPYAGTTKYKDGFDHEVFWRWIREQINKGHSVFISEYAAPPDFECIWQKTVHTSLDKERKVNQCVERLFVSKKQHSTTI